MVKSVWWVVVLLGRQQPSKLCFIFLLESPWLLEGRISPNIHPFEANKHANPTCSLCLTQRDPLFHLKRTKIGWDLTISVGSTFWQHFTTCPPTFGPVTPTYNLKQGSIFWLHCVEIRFALWSVAKFPLCQEIQPFVGHCTTFLSFNLHLLPQLPPPLDHIVTWEATKRCERVYLVYLSIMEATPENPRQVTESEGQLLARHKSNFEQLCFPWQLWPWSAGKAYHYSSTKVDAGSWSDAERMLWLQKRL